MGTGMDLRDSDALWLAGVTVIVAVVYGYHLYRTLRKWTTEEHSERAFRNFFIAVMLEIGLFRILIGSLVRAYPQEHWLVTIQDVTAPLLSLLLLSGGIVILWTWRHE